MIAQMTYMIQILNFCLALGEDSDLCFPGLNLDFSEYWDRTFPKET